jgi:hypothetical protein
VLPAAIEARPCALYERDGDRRGEPWYPEHLRADRLAARRGRPGTAAGVEDRAECGYRAVTEAERAEQQDGHHERRGNIEYSACR